MSPREGEALKSGVTMSPQARHAARVLSSSIAGTFHSHVVSEARPGPRDIREARQAAVLLIYDTIAYEWRLWRIRRGRAYELKYDQL
jgi:proteasome lid subunit RPN8/RPN11